MRSRDAAAAALLALAAAFAALAVWASVARSGIPLAWNGTVTGVEARREKHPGLDDVWYVAVDGHARHVDAALAKRLATGDTVRKQRWQRSLTVNGTEHDLALSREARRMLLVAPLVAVAIAATATVRSGRRSRSPAAQGART